MAKSSTRKVVYLVREDDFTQRKHNFRNPLHCYELCQLIEKQTVYRNPKRKREI